MKFEITVFNEDDIILGKIELQKKIDQYVFVSNPITAYIKEDELETIKELMNHLNAKFAVISVIFKL